MRRHHVLAGVITAACAALAIAPAAPAQDQADQFSFAFTTARAAAPAGFNIEGEFPRQRIIDQIAISFPPGTIFNSRAVRRCPRFTDEQVQQAENGVQDLCPAASKIGTGKGTAYLGDAPDPITFDLGLYNRAGGMVLDILLNDKTAFWAAPTLAGRKLTIPLTQTPDLNARITAFEIAISRKGTARRPYLRTPASCPRSRKHAASLAARENGAGTVTTRDTTACRR
jgi:transglutaminase-like putative cysteine protease